MKNEDTAIHEILTQRKTEVLRAWVQEVNLDGGCGGAAARAATQQEADQLLSAFHEAIGADSDAAQFDGPDWDKARNVL